MFYDVTQSQSILKEVPFLALSIYGQSPYIETNVQPYL